MGRSTYTPTSRDLVIQAARELARLVDNPEPEKWNGIQYYVACDQAYVKLLQAVKQAVGNERA